MGDKNYHTSTINGRIVSKKEYDEYADVMDNLTPSGRKLYQRKMAKGDSSHADVMGALRNIGNGKYISDPKDPFKGFEGRAKGGLIKSRKKSPRKKSIDGLARRGKTKGTQR